MPSGTTAAQVSVNFPTDGTVTTASVSDTVPPVSLSVSNGSNDCLGGLVIGNDAAGQPPSFPSGVSASDVYFNADNGTQTGSDTITDPAALAAFIGPGTMPYTVDQSSEGDVLQSSEWDITFLAHGSITVTVTYTYDAADHDHDDDGAGHAATDALTAGHPQPMGENMTEPSCFDPSVRSIGSRRCGGSGIRTHGELPHTRFPSVPIRPLSHPSRGPRPSDGRGARRVAAR